MEELQGTKIIIPLSKCVSGMKLLQPIIDEKMGTILLPKGSVLNDENIARIKSFEHNHVCVEIKTESMIWKSKEEDIKAYKSYSDSLRYILKSPMDIENIDIKVIKKVAKSLVNTFENNIDALSCLNLINQLEEEPYIHSINVALIAIVIGRWNDYSDNKLEKLAIAGLLHDVGKLEKMSCKSEDEMEGKLRERLSYRRHPITAYEKLVQFKELDIDILKAVLTHHERCDGSGFPLSLMGEKISNMGKIIGLADAYERLRQKMHIFEVIKELKSTNMGCFDIDLLMNFCTNVMNYYIGTHIRLSTGEIAEVECIQPHALYRPIVKTSDKSLDLYLQTHIKIEKVF